MIIQLRSSSMVNSLLGLEGNQGLKHCFWLAKWGKTEEAYCSILAGNCIWCNVNARFGERTKMLMMPVNLTAFWCSDSCWQKPSSASWMQHRNAAKNVPPVQLDETRPKHVIHSHLKEIEYDIWCSNCVLVFPFVIIFGVGWSCLTSGYIGVSTRSARLDVELECYY